MDEYFVRFTMGRTQCEPMKLYWFMASDNEAAEKILNTRFNKAQLKDATLYSAKGIKTL